MQYIVSIYSALWFSLGVCFQKEISFNFRIFWVQFPAKISNFFSPINHESTVMESLQKYFSISSNLNVLVINLENVESIKTIENSNQGVIAHFKGLEQDLTTRINIFSSIYTCYFQTHISCIRTFSSIEKCFFNCLRVFDNIWGSNF